jgi:MFS family permease
MTVHRLDRAVIALGVAAMASALLIFVRFRSDTMSETAQAPPLSKLAWVSPAAAAVLLAFGALAVAGGLLGGKIGQRLAVLAGLGLGAAALAQLVQETLGEKWFGGNPATMALLGAFTVGLLAVGLTPRTPQAT